MPKCDNQKVVYQGYKWYCTNCKTEDCALYSAVPMVKLSWERECCCGANKVLGKDNKHHASYCDFYVKP
jgi:hypothetical protein